MRAGVYRGPETVQVEDWPVPQLASGEALVKVRYAGICGSDILIRRGKHPRVVPPRVLGHEIFGAVAEARPPADAVWKPGMRVAVYPLISCGHCAPCREGASHVCEKLGLIGIDVDGGIAEYVKAQPDQLFAVPDSVSDEQAALVEPLSVAVHAVRSSGFRPGDTALVTGAGPIGNLIAQVLKASGARAIVVSEVKDFRRGLAGRMGFQVVNPAQEPLRETLQRVAGEPFVDRVYEATGGAGAYRDAVHACRVRGEITFVGLPKAPPEVDVLNLVFKEIRTTGARVYERRDYQVAIALLERAAVDVAPLITDQLPLEDAEHGFQKMQEAETSLKILFAP
ncbi:MAG: alcohol dehydrogenase catalytic domain-containing protein [Acidobacteriia bacterium]|nr:alcohol dehydrogenase catalytic domain-containing protein [Terriglobia bacterium]